MERKLQIIEFIFTLTYYFRSSSDILRFPLITAAIMVMEVTGATRGVTPTVTKEVTEVTTGENVLLPRAALTRGRLQSNSQS